MNKKSYLTLTFAALILQACGGSGENNTVLSAPVFTLSISDAPVDGAMQVVACFSEVELRATDATKNKTFLIGDSVGSAAANDLCTDNEGVVINNTRGIDLLTLAGMSSAALLTDIEITPGDYNQIRLTMSGHSYAIVDLDHDGVADDADRDGSPDKVTLNIPSNELKLDGFTALVGQTTELTVEFDLRKGMTNPVGQEGYILKPRGVRIVDNSVSGHIQGTVTESLLSDNLCDVAPADITQPVASVYVYHGSALDAATLADNGGTEGLEALTSVGVLFDGVDTYNFEIGFVGAAKYTLALTCDDDVAPEGDDDVSFISIIEAEVTEQGQITDVVF